MTGNTNALRIETVLEFDCVSCDKHVRKVYTDPDDHDLKLEREAIANEAQLCADCIQDTVNYFSFFFPPRSENEAQS